MSDFIRHITPHMLGMADEGEQVRFLDENGYPAELEDARKHFSKDAVLTVLCVRIGDWSSTYSFEECDGRFNTVMFERVEQSA